MDIIEKINYLLTEKGLSKKEFIYKLHALEPRLKSTGKAPSLQTIYGYLNGKRELKVEMIPYMAEVLGVQEQELFTFEVEYATYYNVRYSKEAREILELYSYAPKALRNDIKELLLCVKHTYEDKIQKIRSTLQ